jgi:hypothetical protein
MNNRVCIRLILLSTGEPIPEQLSAYKKTYRLGIRETTMPAKIDAHSLSYAGQSRWDAYRWQTRLEDFRTPISSEDKFQRKLNYAGRVRLVRDYAERVCIVDVRRRIAKHHPIQDVKELRSKFKIAELTGEVEFLKDGEVFVVKGRATNVGKTRRGIAKGERRRLAKRVDIQVYIAGGIEAAHGDMGPHIIGDPIGTVASPEQLREVATTRYRDWGA